MEVVGWPEMGEGRTPGGAGEGGGWMVFVAIGLEEVIEGAVSVGAVVLGIVAPALVGGGEPRVGRMEIFFFAE